MKQSVGTLSETLYINLDSYIYIYDKRVLLKKNTQKKQTKKKNQKNKETNKNKNKTQRAKQQHYCPFSFSPKFGDFFSPYLTSIGT